MIIPPLRRGDSVFDITIAIPVRYLVSIIKSYAKIIEPAENREISTRSHRSFADCAVLVQCDTEWGAAVSLGQGYFVTSAHLFARVVEDRKLEKTKTFLTLRNQVHSAEVLYLSNTYLDVAILRCESLELPALPLAAKYEIGELSFHIFFSLALSLSQAKRFVHTVSLCSLQASPTSRL